MPPQFTEEQKAKKAKLIAFFRKYAPNDIYKVDVLINSTDSEDKMYRELRSKYNVTAESDDLTNDAADLRQRLTAFYNVYAPGDFGKVDTALQMNVGEAELFNALYTKYKIPIAQQTFDNGTVAAAAAARKGDSSSPPAETTQGARPRSGSKKGDTDREAFKRKLQEVYNRVAPAEADQKVQHAMSLHAAEETILSKIYEKYNLDENGQPKRMGGGAPEAASPQVTEAPRTASAPPQASALPVTTTSSAPQSQAIAAASPAVDDTPERLALKTRLQSFYAVHAPGDVDAKVKHAMGLGLLEDELFQLLERKYGTTAAVAQPPTTTAISQPATSLPRAQSTVQPTAPIVAPSQPVATATTTQAQQPVVAPPTIINAIDYAKAPGSFESRLRAFYGQYNPAEADKKVPVALKMNVPEATLWENLYRNYQLDAQGRPLNAVAQTTVAAAATAPSAAASGSASSGESLETKIRRFYFIYAPEAVDQKTASALGTKLGETELFTVLANKYQISLETALSIANDGSSQRATATAETTSRGATADSAGVTQPTINSYDNNAVTPSIDSAFGSSPPRDVDLDGLRRRLTAFFTRFEPDADNESRVRDSLDVVASGHMTEDELVKFVEQQYGPALELRVTDAAVLPPAAPASPPSTTSSRGDRSVLRRRLENFYRSQQVADYQDKVEYALRLDADDDVIMEKVMQKYSVTQEPPPTASSDSHQQPPTDSRSLLGFTQHPPRASSPPPPPPPDPSGGVSPGQSMSDGLPSLERKRSVTFSDLGRDAGDDATKKRREHLKTRLTAFYQRFNPGNIDKVELALTLDIPEDILFSKLYEKYNLDQNGEPLEVGGAFNRFEGGSGGSPTRSSVFLPSGLPPLPPGALPTTTSAGQPQSPTTVERQNFMTTRKALEDRLFVIYAKNFTSAEAMERSQRVAMLPGESVDDAVARVVKEQEQHGVDAPLLQRVNSVASTLAQQRQPSSSEPLPEGASLHERLTKFYEVHRPSEVSRVEAVLSSGVTEEQVWERLAERYGDDAVAPFRSNAAREMGSRGAHPQPADFTDDVLSRLVSMRSTGTAAAPPRSSSRRSPDPPLSGSALDQLVDRVAEESEDPLVALDRATGHRNAPSLPMRYTVDIQPSTSRAVSFLLRLPDVSMYLIQRATVQQRADFAVSLERDVRGFAQVNGAVGVACETKLSPDDDSVAMQYVALFPTAVGAARFRTLGASSALVPLPATRAAYLLLGGNVHSVKEGRISGAVFAANIPQSLLVSPPQAAPPATSSALAAREAGGGAQQTDINYYEPVVVPDESYSAHNVVDAAARQQSVDGASPMLASLRLRHQRGGHQDISPPKATTAALFTAEDEQHAGDDAREGSREVAPLSKSWGQLLGQQQVMGTTPAAVREQDIQARERSLQAQSIELKDRQRVLQEREAMLRDGELRIRAAQDEERETNRLRRERAAEASMRFESLAIRETEVKERERQLARRQDAITDRERTLDSRASELEQRVAMLDERERRVTLRERQLDEIAPSRAINGSAAGQHGGEPEMAYMADLEKKLREARQRIAVLEGAPSSAVALHAQQQSSTTQSRDMDMRLRHVIEREALVADSEARLERKSHSAMAEVRHDDDNARRRWEELRRQDRELLARRLEIEAVHTSVQRQQAVAASSHSAASTSPQQSSPPGIGSSSRITAASTASVQTAQRSLFTSPQTDATPPPPLNSSFSFHASRDVTSATLLRQDDISTMLNRVKEREKMIRSMSERMTPVRTTNSNWGGSHQF